MNNVVYESSNVIHSCTGCGMCCAVCQKNAITISLDNNGFYKPTVNPEKCVSCGLCREVCYKYDREISAVGGVENYPQCFSAVNKSAEELKSASSGAVSIELMKGCLKRGYIVVGTTYDYVKDAAIAKTTSQDSGLEQFKGSKYFQSYTADTFKEIIRDKSDTKYAVFGTPCQIYALNKAIKKLGKQDKYLLIDIFCHGCPSLNLWKKYLNYYKKKFNIQDFKKIGFRSKKHGWHEYCFDFEADKKHFSSSKFNDPFYELFFSKTVLNRACYDCGPRSTMDYTDIRIGDFWGSRYDNDTKGVSAVVVNTSNGNELWDCVKEKFNYEPADFGEIISSQSYGKTHDLNESIRSEMLDMLAKDITIKQAVCEYEKILSIKQRAKKTAKTLIKHLPPVIYNSVRKIVHKAGRAGE